MTIQAVQAQSPRQQITSLLLAMGVQVEKTLDQAIMALLHSKTHHTAAPVEGAQAIQELESAVDQAVFAALRSGALAQPEAGHATAIINIGKELARLARLADNLGRRVSDVGEHCDDEDFSRLEPLAIAVSHLSRQTLRALAHMDPVLARNAAAASATVDAYRDYVYRGHRQPSLTSSDQNAHLFFASRCLEQIADHLSDLAENLVVFLSSIPATQAGRTANRQQVAC
ncbi:MAG TPA: PhoU domain-containing protein [Candidatus Angelobacter sp.]|nr:PhoU domain-containing protein [Candidatus Angelobacter sp.]